ncbi:unnamed protein product, partial [Brassica rapa subsp. narinosa]
MHRLPSAEALAVRCALLHELSLNLTCSWCQSYSQVLVCVINQNQGSLEPFGVLLYIFYLVSSFSTYRVLCIPRSLNEPADQLAR